MDGSTLSYPQCETVLTAMLATRDWRLVKAGEFCQQVWQRVVVEDASSEESLIKIGVNVYCAAWHAACCSAAEIRTRAYSELAHYLYDRALHKYGDRELAHEITHEALILVAQQIDQVQNPGAFLAFALLKLWNAATAYFRQRDRQERRMQPLPDPNDQEQPDDLADVQTPLPAATAEHNELEAQVRARIDALIAQAPRAHSQFQAVLLKFLHGYSDGEIAAALQTDVANVHVLRSRGLNRLRADAGLRQLFAELVDS